EREGFSDGMPAGHSRLRQLILKERRFRTPQNRHKAPPFPAEERALPDTVSRRTRHPHLIIPSRDGPGSDRNSLVSASWRVCIVVSTSTPRSIKREALLRRWAVSIKARLTALERRQVNPHAPDLPAAIGASRQALADLATRRRGSSVRRGRKPACTRRDSPR